MTIGFGDYIASGMLKGTLFRLQNNKIGYITSFHNNICYTTAWLFARRFIAYMIYGVVKLYGIIFSIIKGSVLVPM